VRKDAMDLEEQISKAEAEKTNRDHAMRSLNDEISGLDELISKLNKEKKFFQVTYLKQNKITFFIQNCNLRFIAVVLLLQLNANSCKNDEGNNFVNS
jgi:hypothetical protein